MAEEPKNQEQTHVPQQEVKIEMSEQVRAGDYANFVRIQHTAMDFRLDFAKAVPDENTLHVVSRMFMSPIHTKMFLKALEDNVKKYEAQFGPIELTPNAMAIPLHGAASKVAH